MKLCCHSIIYRWFSLVFLSQSLSLLSTHRNLDSWNICQWTRDHPLTVVDHIGTTTLMAIPVVKPNSHDLDILSGPTWSVDSDVCSRWEEKMCGMPPVGTPGNTYRLRGYFRHLQEHLGYW